MTAKATKEKIKPQKASVTIEAMIHDSRTLFFREAVGTASAKGQTWEMSLNMGGQHPIIRLPDGRWITFSWQALIEAANDAGRQAQSALARAEGRMP